MKLTMCINLLDKLDEVADLYTRYLIIAETTWSRLIFTCSVTHVVNNTMFQAFFYYYFNLT
jgi:hypothetical protein